MKIAICLSGQLRNWKQCSDSILKLIYRINEKYDTKVDIFCQAWDFNTSRFDGSHRHGLCYYEIESVKISDKEKEELLNIYNPKIYKFETEDQSRKKVADFIKIKIKQMDEGKRFWDATYCASQYYAIKSVIGLKKEYEISNNFIYDICFRLRYDLLFDNHQIDHFMDVDIEIPNRNTVYACHSRLLEKVLGDIFWFAKSETFNRIEEFYDWLYKLDYSQFSETTLTEEILWNYVNECQITMKSLSVDPKIIH